MVAWAQRDAGAAHRGRGEMSGSRAFPAAEPHIAGSCRRTISDELFDREQQEAAEELERLGEHKRASRVRQCGSFGARRCHDRRCPRCTAAVATNNARRALFALGGFKFPAFLTLTLPSHGPARLEGCLHAFRAGLVTWRRRVAVKGLIAGGIGGIEPHLDRNQMLWAVHAHLLLDGATPGLNVDPLRAGWLDVTGGRGRLLVPNGGAAVKSPARAAAYATKRDDWAPPPGALPERALAQLVRSIKGKRLLVVWGTARVACRV